MAWFGKKKKDDDKTTGRQEDARTGRAASSGAKPTAKKGASASKAAAQDPSPKGNPDEQPASDRSARLILQTHAEGRQVLRPPRQYVNETPYAPPAEPAKAKLPKDPQPKAQEPDAPRKSLLRPPARGYREVGQGASGKETLAQAQERERQELQAQRERALASKSTASPQAGAAAASGIVLPPDQELEDDSPSVSQETPRFEDRQEYSYSEYSADRASISQGDPEFEQNAAPLDDTVLRASRAAVEEESENKAASRAEKAAGDEFNGASDAATVDGQANEASALGEYARDPDELSSELAASDFEDAFGLTEAQTEAQKEVQPETLPEAQHQGDAWSADTHATDNQDLSHQALPSNPFDEETEGESFDLPLNSFLTPEEVEEEEQRQKAWADQQRRRDEWAREEERARRESERESQALAQRAADRQYAERAQEAWAQAEVDRGAHGSASEAQAQPLQNGNFREGANAAHHSEERPVVLPEGHSPHSTRADASALRDDTRKIDKNESEEDMQARLSGAGFSHAESASVEEARQDAIDGAAIVFAAGEEDAAAQKLNDCLARTPAKGSERVWWMLMDLRQAQNDRSAFEKIAQGYSEKFGNSPPAWRAPRQERANTVNAANVLMLDGAMRGDAIIAQSKPFMVAAREKKSAKIDVARLDPERSSPDAVASLRQVMTTLRKRKVPSLLMGAGPLSRWLLKRVEAARAKPAPDQADSEPWLLLLEIFQWQGEEQMAQFEELSLAYSIWFELSGPGWDPAGVMPKPAGRDQDPVREGVIEPESVINEVSGGRLQEKIRAEIERAGLAVVDFSSVKRIDFSAAGAFLNFLAQLSGQTQAVTLLEPSELVMALLDVVGVSSYVAVTPRKR